MEKLKTKDENSMVEIKTLKEKVKKLEIENCSLEIESYRVRLAS